ncbi:Glyoxylate reductase [Lentibacillus sp. JNUCC-1]|uniref:2-hydroxyacid dehydrogenase n=1 Tax=Lentibacillus sp. JNUCC-1 TaxID=2654513 RepID=UPI0012E8AE88|nr:D-glycerate dehydrogenase [Lentibacillus sp. JNUCC-1]MUV39217.1 Glyoxylate reductase [Lentibacillus sp. JNUCC-1]
MAKGKIYITRNIPNDIIQPFEDAFEIKMWKESETPVPRDELLRQTQDADGLVCMLSDAIDEELLSQSPQLKVVANDAVGFDNIDLKAANDRNVVVTNTPDVLTDTTADLTFALLMATARRVVEARDYVLDDKWQNWAPFLLAGQDIHHKTIGIVGMGRIGEAVARRAKGFDMNILYHNRSRKEAAEQELGATYVSFDELLRNSDYVVALLPLNKDSEKLFNASAFKQMKSSAIFINVSRGKTVDETALYKALKDGDIHAAGLDVFETEPIDSTHPLLELENVVCLPHIGSASYETRWEMLKLCLDNIKAVLNGNDALTPVK